MYENRVKLRIFIFKNLKNFSKIRKYFQNSKIIFAKTPKISEIIFKNPENSKINLLEFHTKWPENDENYGSLFFKILKTSKIPENYDKIENKFPKF